MASKNIQAPDLTQRPPRSPRVRLGGYVILARCLDKGRATIAGKHGEYHFDCPLDKRFLEFVGIKGPDLRKQLEAGKGDGEILEWVNKNAKSKHTAWEIAQWSLYQEERVPTDLGTREFFNGMHKAAGKSRDDIATWFDLLDVDDHVTFGGKA